MAALGRTASFAHKSRKALAGLPHRGQLDMARAIVDSSSVRAMLAEKKRPEPNGPAQARQQAPPHRRNCPSSTVAPFVDGGPSRCHVANVYRSSREPRIVAICKSQSIPGIAEHLRMASPCDFRVQSAHLRLSQRLRPQWKVVVHFV